MVSYTVHYSDRCVKNETATPEFKFDYLISVFRIFRKYLYMYLRKVMLAQPGLSSFASF